MPHKFLCYIKLFQSTHPARGATYVVIPIRLTAGISIHAPREGCDAGRPPKDTYLEISIHAPREGCDLCRAV